MFEKGRRRESKGLAVLYFIIGLIILLIILGIIYFALVKLDYTDQISDPNAQVRSYVAETPVPTAEPEDVGAFDDITADAEPVSATEAPDEDAAFDDMDDSGDLDFADAEAGEPDPDAFDDGAEPDGEAALEGDEAFDDVDLDEVDAFAPDAGETDVSPEVIQTATPSPTPEPTATPEPDPTKVPASKISKARTKNFKVPSKASGNGVIGITECTVYEQNNNSVMRLSGYGYVNSKKFNGKQAKSYMIVTQRSNGKQIAYQLSMKKGISGRPHPKAKCKNAASSDYRMYINVKKFQDDIYSLALVIAYKPVGGAKVTYAYYPFSSDVSFTVLDGKVVTPVNTVQ